MAKTTVDLPDQVHRTLRVKAVLERRSMNDIIIEAVQDHLGDFRVETRGGRSPRSARSGDGRS